MSRKVPFYMRNMPLQVPLLLCATIVLNTKCVSSLSDHCLEVVKLDIDVIEDHLSKLDLTDVPTVKIMAAGFKCPIAALSFGALKSDWSRLLLLQEAQPEGSIIKDKLVRLMRILIIAYYQMEEHFDVVKPDVRIPKQSPAKETTVLLTNNDTNKQTPSTNNGRSWSTEASNNYYHSHIHTSSMPSLIIESDRPSGNSTTRAEIVAIDNTTSINGTTGIIPFDIGYQNISSVPLARFGAVTDAYYIGNAFKIKKKNAVSKVLDRCLKQPLKDLLRKRPPSRTRNNVFQRLKNKKYVERVRQRNEINDYRGKNRTVSRVSPSARDFRRYAVFPTGAPLTISTVARPYRTQGLNGFRTNPQKSRRRASLNADAYESFGRFYDVDKNRGEP